MQLALNNTGFQRMPLRSRNQPAEPTHEQLRDAVRAWAATENQDVVAALVVDEFRRQGGEGIDFPSDLSRQRQKFMRQLDSDSAYARENVRLLAPAIMAVLPLDFRARLRVEDCVNSRVARADIECAEAKQAVLLDAPEHQKLKEVSEGIASLFRLMPEQIGLLMTMVTTMLGVM